MNKYSNQYIDSISKAIGEYKPFNQIESVTKGLPVAAAGGAGIGALLGGLSQVGDPGYDKDGNKKSRVKQVLKGIALGGVTGGAVGGLGAAAVPSLWQASVSGATNLAKSEIDKEIPGYTLLDKATRGINKGKIDAASKIISAATPNMTTNELSEFAKAIAEYQRSVQK